MRLSTRTRYGTRALLDIGRRQQFSLIYLEHLVTPLIGAGRLRSTRGTRGSVKLTKPPHETKLSEVIKLLEGSIAPADCIDNPGCCPHSGTCAAQEVWDELKKAMNGILESRTSGDMIELQKAKEQSVEEMYYI